MGSAFREWCRCAVRPLLIAAVVAGAWLVLAAVPASAGPDKPNPQGGIAQAAESLSQKAVHKPVPVIGRIPVHAVRDVPVPVIAAPPPVTATLRETALTTTATRTVTDGVGGAVHGVVSAVDSSVAAASNIRIPGVPVPEIPRVHLPKHPAHVADKVTPRHSSGTAGPQPGVRSAKPAPAALGALATFRGSLGRAAGSGATTDGPQQVQLVALPAESLADTHGVPAPAATLGYVMVSAAPAPENEPDALRFVGTQNQTGPSSAGAGNAGAEASGDVAGFWNLLHHAGRHPVPDTALMLAASPAFDPGSSPD